jgi:hypothetical protein
MTDTSRVPARECAKSGRRQGTRYVLPLMLATS